MESQPLDLRYGIEDEIVEYDLNKEGDKLKLFSET